MTAGPTFTKIESQTLSSATATVSFTSFSGYTDLFLSTTTKWTGSGDNTFSLRFNSDTSTSNYCVNRFFGEGGTVYMTSNSSTFSGIGAGRIKSSEWSTNNFDILSYSGTTFYKTIMNQSNSPGTLGGMFSGTWNSTSAITTIALGCFEGGSNFASGSIFSLYGILKA